MKRQMARRFWWLVTGTAAVLAAAALAVLGSFGLLGGGSSGNGPLFMGSYGLDGWSGKKPQGIIIPVISRTHATIVIDGIRLVGGAGYPAPRPFALRVMIVYNQCAGILPLRRTGHGLVLGGCITRDLGPLIGHRGHWSGSRAPSPVEAVAKVWPPRSKSCWVLTHVAVRYHIGARHFSAIYPDAEVMCSGIATPVEQAIMDQAAEEASH